jgi:predicted phage terminase large subunit-like protein
LNGWSVVYKRAINDDGSLLFPERLTKEFLEAQRRSMGSYLFANQYQNQIIPAEDQTFKPHWLRYASEIPDRVHSFGFIDPAISEADTADYTGFVVISVDCDQNWYVRHAQRERLNPSALIDKAFQLCDHFNLMTLGVEDVAFQRAILHFAYEEMKRRNKRIPITGVKRGSDKTKEMRILGLVPRFEFGSLFLTQGLHDLEMEIAEFPRGAHDDILDSLASLESIVVYPQKIRKTNAPPHPNDPGYESWYIRNKLAGAAKRADGE